MWKIKPINGTFAFNGIFLSRDVLEMVQRNSRNFTRFTRIQQQWNLNVAFLIL